MCKACFLRKSEPLCDEYLDRYSEPFERSCQELAVAIKGLKYIKGEADPEYKSRLTDTLKRLRLVAQELNSIRENFGVGSE